MFLPFSYYILGVPCLGSPLRSFDLRDVFSMGFGKLLRIEGTGEGSSAV